MSAERRRISFVVVVPPRALLLDLTGPLEVLRVANAVQDRVLFDVAYVGPRGETLSSIGLALSGVAPLPETIPADSILFLSGSAKSGLAPWPNAAEDDAAMERIVDWLRAGVRPDHTLLMVCEGALLAARRVVMLSPAESMAARAGLLDGYACTTHHASCASLAEAAPRAKVLDNRLFVEDRKRLSSAGVTAGIDLMLHAVAGWCGPAVAVAVARTLVLYVRRGPSDPQLSPWLEGRNHLHPAVHRAQDAIAADPARGWSLEELGQVAGASARNLSRLFMAHTGMSVTIAVQRARLALVNDLLTRTDLGLEEVAARAGFGSARHMRRVWKHYHAQAPSEVRASAGP